jgi:hypothetical protein
MMRNTLPPLASNDLLCSVFNRISFHQNMRFRSVGFAKPKEAIQVLRPVQSMRLKTHRHCTGACLIEPVQPILTPRAPAA